MILVSNKREHSTTENFLGIPGTEYQKTVVTDDKGNRGEASANTREESIEKAHQRYRENKK